MKRFMAGFSILCKYEPDGDIAAEHDEVYAGETPPDKMTEEERVTLKDNGWTWEGNGMGWHKFV